MNPNNELTETLALKKKIVNEINVFFDEIVAKNVELTLRMRLHAALQIKNTLENNFKKNLNEKEREYNEISFNVIKNKIYSFKTELEELEFKKNKQPHRYSNSLYAILFNEKVGELNYLATHIGLLQLLQKNLSVALGVKNCNYAQVCKINDKNIVILVDSNAAKQKLSQMEKRILEKFKRIIPNCEKINFKVNLNKFVTQDETLKIHLERLKEYPLKWENKWESKKITPKMRNELKEKVANIDPEFREIFENIFDNLENVAVATSEPIKPETNEEILNLYKEKYEPVRISAKARDELKEKIVNMPSDFAKIFKNIFDNICDPNKTADEENVAVVTSEPILSSTNEEILNFYKEKYKPVRISARARDELKEKVANIDPEFREIFENIFDNVCDPNKKDEETAGICETKDVETAITENLPVSELNKQTTWRR